METKLETKLETRLYEGMFLVDSNLAAKDWTSLEGHMNGILEKNKAAIRYSEKWPDRRLAYEVKGCKKGTYYLIYFDAPPQAVDAIHKDSNLSERILRLMIINHEGLEEEMTRRKNRELTAPPAELSFEDSRGGRDRWWRGRRGDSPSRETPGTPPPKDSSTTEKDVKSTPTSTEGPSVGETKPKEE